MAVWSEAAVSAPAIFHHGTLGGDSPWTRSCNFAQYCRQLMTVKRGEIPEICFSQPNTCTYSSTVEREQRGGK